MVEYSPLMILLLLQLLLPILYADETIPNTNPNILSNTNNILNNYYTTLTKQEDLERGWGNQYTWYNFNESLRRAQIEDKPIMLIYWKSWCGVCKLLQDNFKRSESIRSLSRKFIMVNIGDEIEMDTMDINNNNQDNGDYIQINHNGEQITLDPNDKYNFYTFWNPNHSRFAPDGSYVPRVIFVNNQGNVMDDIINLSIDHNSQYKYFYPSDTSIAVAMQRAAVAYNTKVSSNTKDADT